MLYAKAISRLATILADKKKSRHLNSAMIVSIEGLSNAGKSTLSTSLGTELGRRGYSQLPIEGDLFYVGRERALEYYTNLIRLNRSGEPIEIDYHNRAWRYDLLEKQVLKQVKLFNLSDKDKGNITLEDVLTDKQDGTEHNIHHVIDRKTIIVVPALFLRHLEGFDYSIKLQISPETSIERKIERDRARGSKQNPDVSRDVVMLIEYPAMVRHNYLTKNPDITLDTEDFENVKLI